MCEIRIEDCKLGFFQDASFTGDLRDSKSTNVRRFTVRDHTRFFFPISWMCKEQTAVSHSSAESEIASLEAGLRIDGSPALQFANVSWKHYPVSQPRETWSVTHGKE